MNLWKWYGQLKKELDDAGQGASVELLERYSDHVAELQFAQADALLPQVKAIVKSLGNPWLEVYFGHEEMRNRMSKNEGESALGEAVALFERAHRDDTIDCPQSICITQDLASSYANTDGPGYALERREIVEQTLQRIDPSWPCYTCLRSEYVEALQHEDRHEDALAYLDDCVRALHEIGDHDLANLPLFRVDSLLALGRAEEAMTVIAAEEAAVQGPEWEADRQGRESRKALVLATLGRDEEAWEALPDWQTLAPLHYWKWFRTISLLVTHMPERNDWMLGSRLQAGVDHFSQNGAHRYVIDNALIAADLALQRQATWSAQRLLDLARAHLPKLRSDFGAAARVQALAQRIEQQAGNAPLPVPAEELLAWLEAQEGDRNPEREAQWLCQAVQQRPDDIALLQLTHSALQACAAHGQGIGLLWNYVNRHTQHADDIAFLLLRALLQNGQRDEAQRLAQLFRNSEPAFYHWCQAQLARVADDWNAVVEHSQQVLADQADRVGARHLLALALRQLERFDEAAAQYLALSELDDAPDSVLWDHMTAATAAGDWAAVRAGAKRLEIELSGSEGPVEESWGWVILRVSDNGEWRDYYALRTGPVSARIMENAPGNAPQHVMDEYAFDASYLEEPPEDEEQRQRFLYTFGVVHRLKVGGYGRSWWVEALHPGEERLNALRENLEGQGYQVWVHRQGYPITDLENPEAQLTGLFLSVAAPEGTPAFELQQSLATELADLADTACWPALAEHCGADMTRQQAFMDRYES
ncbi:MAG: hypothetical protein GAK43_00960 [Stenotrophomonas maltophilia]|nr:MAG: hypothetical protein GAK43_00960 [Stenotrophomonas maltophilia]